MMKRRIKWVLVNGAMAACMVAGLRYGVAGAWNVFVFVTVVCLVCETIIFCNKDTRAAMRNEVNPINSVVEGIFDVLVTLFLAWNAEYAVAICYMLMSVVQKAMHNGKPEEVTK